MRARIAIAGAALLGGGLSSTWRAGIRAPAEGGSVDGAAPVQARATTVLDPPRRGPTSSGLLPPSSAGAEGAAAASGLKPPARSQPIATPPQPGADDPGPGPWIERYDGRSGRLSPSTRPEAADPTTRV